MAYCSRDRCWYDVWLVSAVFSIWQVELCEYDRDRIYSASYRWLHTFITYSLFLLLSKLNWIHGMFSAWWRHQMETFSALLAFCAGNSLVTGEFPSQSPVTRNFDVFFDLYLKKRLSKQSSRRWFEAPSHPLWRHCNEEWGKFLKRALVALDMTMRIIFIFDDLNCARLQSYGGTLSSLFQLFVHSFW